MGKTTMAICMLAFSSLSHADWYSEQHSIMGTNIHIELWAESEGQAHQGLAAVVAEIHRIDNLMSSYKTDSELSRINREAASAPMLVSDEMFELLQTAQNISQRSHGAFDITFASAGFLYDYRQHQKPTDAQLQHAIRHINYRLVLLDEAKHTVYFNHPDVKIDLGGIAKGHAVDQALEKLRALGIEHALVTAGGDTGLLGDKRGKPWIVGIRDPRNRDRQAVVLPLENIALSTSGDYERFFEENGVRYHHILSPKTGQSAHEVQSVSISGPLSTLTDGLSTAVFVLGVQEGMDLINRIPGYEAIIMDSERRLHYSQGLQR
ncbi:FAD:protein FMN transferase [Bowmanella sp. JS7-9]|uniref:FAD:protein FMN transferase n=1 Tax=Pseudobowmanella zhangzhouensis TaxID=1537679 RepID=A0ABW1XI55_9ALTE|nr:FAD:protein FMN transferase [Bowmanella sp. JS7-9]TBX27614.1 thiamine biosynthesis protein ApbE [Bowmanella sp. JS7-9]